jgi:hypothetical protein
MKTGDVPVDEGASWAPTGDEAAAAGGGGAIEVVGVGVSVMSAAQG